MNSESLSSHYRTLTNLLLQEKNDQGFWTGRLASSALSTAVAMVAIKIRDDEGSEERIASGLNWLLSNANSDGGFGDTPESISNVSTSMLCYAAIRFCQTDRLPGHTVLAEIEKYLQIQGINMALGNVIPSILKYYGKDYTFSVPILSMLVICGVLDRTAVNNIPQLPFEFTLFPAKWYGFFNMQVVSYAIPALVAVGIFAHKQRRYRNPLLKAIRNKSIASAIRKLSATVPESGGFLEAIPLTAFVSMCLIISNVEAEELVVKGISFLKKQQRTDGSWPIDTDLSTWVTTLSIKALGKDIHQVLPADSMEKLRNHLLSIQYKEKHPFNQALPGGWGWTNYSGSVPDVDDTSGAILALLEMYQGKPEETMAILNGCQWLVTLQNKDGGFPTFCRGWSRLPFDKSCADLTGHALAALTVTIDNLGNQVSSKSKKLFSKSIQRAAEYLRKEQNQSGYWLPLWFGNQYTENKANPIYGTAKVSIYLIDCLNNCSLDSKLKASLEKMVSHAQQFLLSQQNSDGSWGGSLGIKGSIEETSLALCVLTNADEIACSQGFQWLRNEFDNRGMISKPIGLYFATLWYDEKLYPLVYYIEALRKYLNIYQFTN